MNAEYDAIFESVEKVGIKVTEKVSICCILKLHGKRFTPNVPVSFGCAVQHLLGFKSESRHMQSLHCICTDLQDPKSP